MEKYEQKAGEIVIITGPMFAEKTGELIRRCKKMVQYGKKRVKIYKPTIDNRFSEDSIVSRVGMSFPAENLGVLITEDVAKEILSTAQDYDVVGFDEAQFFSEGIIQLVTELSISGKMVMIAGLNMDFTGRAFGQMGNLMAMADTIEMVRAYCSKCGELSSYTQKLVDGKPANKNEPLVVIGDTETYEPRCIKHYVPPME